MRRIYLEIAEFCGSEEAILHARRRRRRSWKLLYSQSAMRDGGGGAGGGQKKRHKSSFKIQTSRETELVNLGGRTRRQEGKVPLQEELRGLIPWLKSSVAEMSTWLALLALPPFL